MWQRKYKGIGFNWENISEKLVKSIMKGHYTKVDALLEELKASPGRVTNMSPYSYVRWIENNGPEN
jgi:hypothetical protein